MFDVITIGSATRDVFMMSKAMHPHKAKDATTHIEACFPFGAKINIDDLYFDTGGGATNNAATFARLGGLRVAAICRVGNDINGRDIRSSLKDDAITTQLLQMDKKEQTAYSVILSPSGESGERTILVYRGASANFSHTAIPWSHVRAKWFYASSLGGDLTLLKKLLAHAKKTKAQVAFNPGGQELKQAKKARPLFKQPDFLNLNREESARLTGVPYKETKRLLKALLRFASRAIMTDGADGAYAVTPETAVFVPSGGHKAVNRTGAGDAFGSGFITGWMKSKGDLGEALRVGTYNADSVVQYIGAKNGILEKYPSQATLKKLKLKTLKI